MCLKHVTPFIIWGIETNLFHSVLEAGISSPVRLFFIYLIAHFSFLLIHQMSTTYCNSDIQNPMWYLKYCNWIVWEEILTAVIILHKVLQNAFSFSAAISHYKLILLPSNAHLNFLLLRPLIGSLGLNSGALATISLEAFICYNPI